MDDVRLNLASEDVQKTVLSIIYATTKFIDSIVPDYMEQREEICVNIALGTVFNLIKDHLVGPEDQKLFVKKVAKILMENFMHYEDKRTNKNGN
jgi:hypothetical protein